MLDSCQVAPVDDSGLGRGEVGCVFDCVGWEERGICVILVKGIGVGRGSIQRS